MKTIVHCTLGWILAASLYGCFVHGQPAEDESNGRDSQSNVDPTTTSKLNKAKVDQKAATGKSALATKPTAKTNPDTSKHVAKTEPVKPAVSSSRATKQASTEPAKMHLYYVTATTLNLRSAPTTNAPIVGTLKRGSSIKATVKGQWAKIGNEQFVVSKFLNSKEPQEFAGTSH